MASLNHGQKLYGTPCDFTGVLFPFTALLIIKSWQSLERKVTNVISLFFTPRQEAYSFDPNCHWNCYSDNNSGRFSL